MGHGASDNAAIGNYRPIQETHQEMK